ncbi:MAG: hypothetical protein FWC46_07455 [Actinomycetia bacterium]|nr:hypothetical protein [Actinomycetes bacterium]
MSQSSTVSDSAPAPSSADDELRSLVPRRTRLATGLIGLACALALVTSWFVPAWFNPRLGVGRSASTSGLWNTPFVEASVQLPPSQPVVTVTGVDDIPGARIIAAWVTHDVAPGFGDDQAWNRIVATTCDGTTCGPTPGAWRPSDAASLIDALVAGGSPLATAGLPQRVRPNDVLWVIWEITDCDAWPPNTSSVEVRLRGAAGIPTRQTYSGLPTPFDDGREQLDEWGACQP